MALSRIQTEFTFRSIVESSSYYFTVKYDQNSLVSVRDIQNQYGQIQDSVTALPKAVMDDIQTAIGQVKDTLVQTSAVNGTATFTAETYKNVTFTTAMSNANYRVLTSLVDFITVRVINKTTTGFRIEVGSTYTGTISYDVLV